MSKFDEMKEFNDRNVSMPDGAFFQLAEDIHGWTVDDWHWFSKQCVKRKTYPAQESVKP